MKAYKFKAIMWLLVGLLHIFFWRHLPNPVLAAVIATLSFILGAINIAKWIVPW
jgi:hypothetical protein